MKKALLIATVSAFSISVAHAASCSSDATQMLTAIAKNGTGAISANHGFYLLNFLGKNPVQKVSGYCTDTGAYSKYLSCQHYDLQWQSGNWGNTLTVTKYWNC